MLRRGPQEGRLSDRTVVTVDGNLDNALRVLRRRVGKAGIPTAVRRHVAAEPPGARRRRKSREARKRARRTALRQLEREESRGSELEAAARL